MTPSALVELLLQQVPTIPGIAAAQPWKERPYGLQVVLAAGGSTYWMATGATHVAPAAGPEEHLGPQAVPDLSGPKVAVADVEGALVAAIASANSEHHVIRADRYSTRSVPPAVGYGATLDFADQSRAFLALVATARQGEQPREQRFFKPDAEV